MTESATTQQKPLWLLIEEKILELKSSDIGGSSTENSVRRMAEELDKTGHNVSRAGGNLLQLRWAVAAREKVGKPLMEDLNAAIASLTLEQAVDTYAATMKIIGQVGESWPKLKEADRIVDVKRMVESAKLDLLIKKAKTLQGDEGVRLLISEEVAPQTILTALGITDEKLAEVNAAIEAERAEIARVKDLLKEVEDKPEQERIKHLMQKEVADALILELTGVDKQLIENVKAAVEQELEEKRKKEAEEAARKKAESEGPPLEDIPAETLLEHIESIREIMEFSDKEDEIRKMCEQSQLPKCLVDIAVSDKDKLDELEKGAGG